MKSAFRYYRFLKDEQYPNLQMIRLKIDVIFKLQGDFATGAFDEQVQDAYFCVEFLSSFKIAKFRLEMAGK